MLRLLFLIMFLPSIAFADIYKCHKSGGYFLSSEPCNSGSLIYKSELPVESASVEPQVRRIAIRRGENGIFNIQGNINGRTVGIVIDTGASYTTVSGRVAHDLGVNSCPKVAISHTANGDTGLCKIRVAHISFGGFEFNDVPLMVSPNMFNDVLIGNDYLAAFKVELQDDVMILSH